MTVPDNEKVFRNEGTSTFVMGYSSAAGVSYQEGANHFYFKINASYEGGGMDLPLAEAKRMHEHLGKLIADYEADKPAVPKNSEIIAGLKPGSIFTLERAAITHTWVRIIGGARNVLSDQQFTAFYLWDHEDTELVVVFENTN